MSKTNQGGIIKLTWVGVERMLHSLVARDNPDILIGHVDAIVGISRGGLAIAQMLGYLLDVRNIYTLALHGYDVKNLVALRTLNAPDPRLVNNTNTIFVDDIADTGRTMCFVSSKYPNAGRYTLVVKPQGRPFVQYSSMLVDQDLWVEFPWEIKEGARQIPYAQESASPQ